MEYAKLEKPIYWMGFMKGKFTKRKFVECQVPFPRYLRDEEGNVRFFSKNMENEINKIRCVGGYSKYSYTSFTDVEEVEFLKMIVKRNEERIHQEQKKISMIERETEKMVDLIKEKEKDE